MFVCSSGAGVQSPTPLLVDGSSGAALSSSRHSVYFVSSRRIRSTSVAVSHSLRRGVVRCAASWTPGSRLDLSYPDEPKQATRLSENGKNANGNGAKSNGEWTSGAPLSLDLDGAGKEQSHLRYEVKKAEISGPRGTWTPGSPLSLDLDKPAGHSGNGMGSNGLNKTRNVVVDSSKPKEYSSGWTPSGTLDLNGISKKEENGQQRAATNGASSQPASPRSVPASSWMPSGTLDLDSVLGKPQASKPAAPASKPAAPASTPAKKSAPANSGWTPSGTLDLDSALGKPAPKPAAPSAKPAPAAAPKSTPAPSGWSPSGTLDLDSALGKSAPKPAAKPAQPAQPASNGKNGVPAANGWTPSGTLDLDSVLGKPAPKPAAPSAKPTPTAAPKSTPAPSGWSPSGTLDLDSVLGKPAPKPAAPMAKPAPVAAPKSAPAPFGWSPSGTLDLDSVLGKSAPKPAAKPVQPVSNGKNGVPAANGWTPSGTLDLDSVLGKPAPKPAAPSAKPAPAAAPKSTPAPSGWSPSGTLDLDSALGKSAPKPAAKPVQPASNGKNGVPAANGWTPSGTLDLDSMLGKSAPKPSSAPMQDKRAPASSGWAPSGTLDLDAALGKPEKKAQNGVDQSKSSVAPAPEKKAAPAPSGWNPTGTLDLDSVLGKAEKKSEPKAPAPAPKKAAPTPSGWTPSGTLDLDSVLGKRDNTAPAAPVSKASPAASDKKAVPPPSGWTPSGTLDLDSVLGKPAAAEPAVAKPTASTPAKQVPSYSTGWTPGAPLDLDNLPGKAEKKLEAKADDKRSPRVPSSPSSSWTPTGTLDLDSVLGKSSTSATPPSPSLYTPGAPLDLGYSSSSPSSSPASSPRAAPKPQSTSSYAPGAPLDLSGISYAPESAPASPKPKLSRDSLDFLADSPTPPVKEQQQRKASELGFGFVPASVTLKAKKDLGFVEAKPETLAAAAAAAPATAAAPMPAVAPAVPAREKEEAEDEVEVLTLGKEVNVTPDGGVRKVLLVPGWGRMAVESSTLKVHFRGTLPERKNKEFNSSYKDGRPLEIRLGSGELISGWEEALKTMCVGEKARFIVEPHYGYGDKGVAPVIHPNAQLEFTIELLEVDRHRDFQGQGVEDEVQEEATAREYNAIQRLRDPTRKPVKDARLVGDPRALLGREVDITSDNGVCKTLLMPGWGRMCEVGDRVVVSYVGRLPEHGNREFSSSANAGEPFKFTLGAKEVIRGWEYAVMTMRVGEKAKFLIAPNYAYGANSIPNTIPPNATLEFEIELVDIEQQPKGAKWLPFGK